MEVVVLACFDSSSNMVWSVQICVVLWHQHVFFSLPSLASLSSFSLPSILVYARILYNVVGYILSCNNSTISYSKILSRWLW